jgi:hypothetical protein
MIGEETGPSILACVKVKKRKKNTTKQRGELTLEDI